jgi:hypothetical protein
MGIFATVNARYCADAHRVANHFAEPNGLLGGVLINRGCRAACPMSAFPHSDHAADMPDRSELGHKETHAPQQMINLSAS